MLLLFLLNSLEQILELRIFRLLGMPFFRLRVESPGSMRSDEWYALLTEEVVPHLNPGQPLRSTVF